MDACVENVAIEPASGTILKNQASSEEKNRGSHVPRYADAPDTAAQGTGSVDSPEAPQAETPAEKNPWAGWAWLGLCKTSAPKIPNTVHVDVDAFFASVEQVLNPKLRGKPVLVGRGCVASASYEAKFRGVKTAMSFREALRICPNALVVAGQYEHYADYAERVRRILETYTPAVETAALDDFYLDFAGTERLYPNYEAALRRVQTDVLEQTGLSVSVGAA
ncbi:MAG: DNA polymerase Y family protein, partial [Candidatus Acidiferrum sp.]